MDFAYEDLNEIEFSKISDTSVTPTHRTISMLSSCGPFQHHVCDQKSGKHSLLNGYSSWYKHAINKFWLIIVHPVRVKTYRSLKIKFFVKVKNKVHVTIGHVCDFARNYGPDQNDLSQSKSSLMCYGILYWAIHRWRTLYLQTISYTSYEILSSGFLLMQYFFWSRLWHFGVTFGSRLWHFWYRSCAHSCTDRKASQFLFWKYFSSTK